MAKKKADSGTKKQMTAWEREELLIENFVGLQKVMTTLSIRFEKLSDSILKLLEVFEESARSIAGGKGGGAEGDKDLLRKIDSLLEQNKTIAKGLVLMEEKVRQRAEQPEFQPKQLPRI